jgi:hypothetical protein
MLPEIHRRTNPQPPKLSIKFDVTIVIGSQHLHDKTIAIGRYDPEHRISGGRDLAAQPNRQPARIVTLQTVRPFVEAKQSLFAFFNHQDRLQTLACKIPLTTYRLLSPNTSNNGSFARA